MQAGILLETHSSEKEPAIKQMGTVQIIFVNTTAKKSGLDHVGLYFKEISITNDDGQIV